MLKKFRRSENSSHGPDGCLRGARLPLQPGLPAAATNRYHRTDAVHVRRPSGGRDGPRGCCRGSRRAARSFRPSDSPYARATPHFGRRQRPTRSTTSSWLPLGGASIRPTAESGRKLRRSKRSRDFNTSLHYCWAVARIEGTDIACEVKLKSSLGSGRVSAKDETNGSFVASTNSTRANRLIRSAATCVTLCPAVDRRGTLVSAGRPNTAAPGSPASGGPAPTDDTGLR